MLCVAVSYYVEHVRALSGSHPVVESRSFSMLAWP